tara:strand:- start:2243 stop:3151 length:909 start_codon:yes stop_codon:yes gene_type:complete
MGAAANPSMIQALGTNNSGGGLSNRAMTPVGSGEPLNRLGVAQRVGESQADYDARSGITPRPSGVGGGMGAPQNITPATGVEPRGGGASPAPSGGGMGLNNPYNQASMAQMGALSTYSNPAAAAANMMNPYNQQVVDATLRDVGNASQMAMNNLDAQAQQAGAFGGSRHGIAMAELGKGFNQQALDQVSRLRQQGYNQSMNDAFRAAQGLQSAGQQSFGYGQAIQNQQMQQGSMQQALMQQLINAAKGQYGGYTDAPMNKLQLPLAALGVAPKPESSTTTKDMGIYDYLTAGASALYGMPTF